MVKKLVLSDLKRLDEEEWRDIIGFEGSYQISNYGRVRSLTRVIINSRTGNKEGIKTIKGRIMKPADTNIILRKDGKSCYFKVTRLMLLAFIGEPEDKSLLACARHLDDNPKNNHISNVVWGTDKHNYDDAVRNGKHGSGSPGAILRGLMRKGVPRPIEVVRKIVATKQKANWFVENARRKPRDELGRFVK